MSEKRSVKVIDWFTDSISGWYTVGVSIEEEDYEPIVYRYLVEPSAAINKIKRRYHKRFGFQDLNVIKNRGRLIEKLVPKGE